MFVLLPQFPPLVGDFAFVKVMSRKSISLIVVHVVIFNVLTVPLVIDFKNKRLTALVPEVTIVPIVIESNENIIIPALAGAVNVNVPEIVAPLPVIKDEFGVLNENVIL